MRDSKPEDLKYIEELKAEIESLKREIQALRKTPIISQLCPMWKAEAIKAFAERLKGSMQDLARLDNGGSPLFIVGTEFVDNLVKKMVGEKDV